MNLVCVRARQVVSNILYTIIFHFIRISLQSTTFLYVTNFAVEDRSKTI